MMRGLPHLQSNIVHADAESDPLPLEMDGIPAPLIP